MVAAMTRLSGERLRDICELRTDEWEDKFRAANVEDSEPLDVDATWIELAWDALGDLLSELDAVRGENTTLRGALTFYADETNWTQLTSWGGRIADDEAPAQLDYGKTARSALAAVSGAGDDQG